MATNGTDGRRAGILWRRLGTWQAGLVIGVTLTLLVISVVPRLGRQASEPVERGKIVIMSGDDESPGRQRERLIGAWNALHPDNIAEIRSLSTSADKQHSAMVANAQVGDGAIDIYNLDVTWVDEFAAAQFIRPLDSFDTSGFLRTPLETGSYQDHRYAIPFNTDVGLLYYRTDLVDAGRLPAQLPPDPDYSATLVSRDPDLRAAYAGQSDGEGETVNAIEAIRSAGGEVVDPATGSVVIESDAARAGLRQLARAIRPPSGPPSEIGGTEEDNAADFRDGKVALMRNWPVHYGDIVGAAGGKEPARPVAGRFGVARLPFHGVLGGQDLAIAADTTKPRLAQQLIAFLTSPANQATLFADGGFAPVRDSAYHDPDALRRRPYAPTLLAAVDDALPRPRSVYYPVFSAAFRDLVHYALAHQGELPERASATLADALHGRRH
jgi:ABC-type glycerol-3-phosphate transport system substrate-binding protein